MDCDESSAQEAPKCRRTDGMAVDELEGPKEQMALQVRSTLARFQPRSVTVCEVPMRLSRPEK